MNSVTIKRKASGLKDMVNIITYDKWGNIENAFIDVMESDDRFHFEQLEKGEK